MENKNEAILSPKNIAERGRPSLKDLMCIHEYFMDIAVKEPDHPCIEQNHKVYTYGEINQESNKLASFLKKMGAGPEVMVGLFMERSPEVIISMLAILKAGAAYVPISSNYPKDRVEFIANDAGLAFILTSSSLEHMLTEIDFDKSVKRVVLDIETAQIESEPDTNLPNQNDLSNLSYVIYTSGSTGKPKGVMIEHLGFSNVILDQIGAFQLTPKDRVLQFASISFDASVSEIFTTLVSGATLVLLPSTEICLGEDLYNVLKNKKISVVTLTPSVLNTLPSKDLPDLKTLVSAGESCTKKLIDYWAARLRFLNAYGPTESTICASMNLCRLVDDSISLGNPIANTALYLVDEQMKQVPVGETGELCIASVGLARCYINLPSLTESRFVKNPFNDGISTRLYKTGDLCRRISEDAIEWVGRIDNQVKISGIRVDLDELAHVLREYSGVQDAVVIVVDDNFNNKQIYSYIITDSENHLSIKELKNFLKSRIPAYMVPSRFMFLDKIPVLESGKLDRSRLPSMEDVRPYIDVAYVAPRNETENTLSQIWSEILKIDNVGIYDNFFDLGGQSLMATQIVSHIRSTFGIEIPLHVLFDTAPTIEQMAAALENYQIAQSKPEELEKLLDEIESMSEDEAAAMLREIEL